MAALSFQIIGLEALTAGVQAGPPTLLAQLRTAVVAGSLLFEGEARTLAPRDTGRLAGSITHAIGGGGLTSRIGPSVAYGLYAEQGRGAGRMPPVGAVAGWAGRHGINPYLLARAIGRKGTKGRPFMAPAFARKSGQVIGLFGKIPDVVVTRMAG
jgi:hypothetical protein